MRAFSGLLRFLVPLIVLYTIGYYVPGFSALTYSWLVLLAVLIYIGNWAVNRLFSNIKKNNLGLFIMNFLVATVVTFFSTLVIKGGHVPLGASLLAALFIGVLQTLISTSSIRKSSIS